MKKIFSILLIIILCMLTGCQLLVDMPSQVDSAISTDGKLVVSFIDVGQGDSAFIEFPGGKTALIDAGEAEAAQAVVSYLSSRGCEKIDYVICTHPHSDHIGGMVQVLSCFAVGEIYMPRAVHTSKTYERLLLATQAKGLKIHTAKAGVTIPADPAVTVNVVAPVSDGYEEMNDYSAVLHITYGEHSFLLTGDAEKVSEKEMLASGQNLQADVLKVGHHGSSTSSHKKFLEAVAPTYGVISCDGNNEYGHPHDKIVKRLDEYDVTIYRTDLHGTVIFVSDGAELEIITEEEENVVYS